MRIACFSKDAASQLIDVLRRHSVTQGVRWESSSSIDGRLRVFANATIDPDEEAAIRRDIQSIVGAAVRE